MFGIALKSLVGHKLRMLLTVFSIVIGVSFVAGTYIFTDSMSKTFDTVFNDAYASVDLTVRRQQDSGVVTATVDKSLLDKLEAVDFVDIIEPEIVGSAQLFAPNGDLIGGKGPPTFGFSWTNAPELSPLRINDGDGQPPQNAGEVVIDKNTAQINGFSVGDTVKIQAETPVEEFTIVGLATFGEANTLAGATIAAFEFEEAQRILSLPNQYSQINITAIDGVSTAELKQKIDQILPEGLESVTSEQQITESLDEINEGLGFLTTALLAFAGIAIFVGSFIIQNTFRIIVAQRSKELALLRAIGATRRQVVSLVVYEAFIVSIVASVIGIIAGVAISYALRGISNALGFGLPEGELTLQPRTIYISLAVGVFVTVLSALMPAVKASRVSPVEGLRDSEGLTPRKSLHKRALAGFTITGVGTSALLIGLFSSVANPIIFVGAGAAIMFIGTSIIAPLLSKPLATVLGYPIKKWYGLVGQIAQGNTKRTPRRTASTAAALMIGVSLVVLISIFASSIKATIDVVIADSLPGDITLTSKLSQSDPFGATFPASVANDVEALDEVEQVTRLKYDYVELDNETTLIIAIEPDTFNEGLNLKPNNPYDDLTLDTVYINEDTLEEKGLSVGDDIIFNYIASEPSTLKITGSFEDAFDAPFLISAETHAANFTNDKDLFAIANFVDGVDPVVGKQAIDKVVAKYPIVIAQDKGELVTQARTQIDQLLGLMGALLGFAVIIAVLGITNTLTLSVAERTREIGMLRAVGMTRSQIRKMIRAEAIIIAVFGAILGVVMGIFFGWAMLKALEDLGLTAFSVPIVQIGIYLLLSALAGVIAAILPSYKASRMNILNAINYQ